ncbi:hypothetical protein AB0F15_30080, partial [Amycolatopsis sp. NPDC026612]
MRALFVHGAFVRDGAGWWQPTADVLARHGLRSSAAVLPRCEGDPRGDLYADDGAAARLTVQNEGVFGQPVTRATWREVPSTYVVCGEDRATPPETQRAQAARATDVVELPVAHHPFDTRPRPGGRGAARRLSPAVQAVETGREVEHRAERAGRDR